MTETAAEPASEAYRREVVEGLARSPKAIHCKFLYDQRGSELFDRICELPEYYPTRTELGIMRDHAGEMAMRIGPRALLIEYGSGSSLKTPILLDALEDPVAYVPIDISREHLMSSVERLAERYPELEILPVAADYTSPVELPEPRRHPERRVVYFPGSTIGNFEPGEAREFLRRMAGRVDHGGGVLIGVDLEKDDAVLEAAYNDAQGVTAEFNLNLLRRFNRELGADFDLDAFRHLAFYNRDAGRIELHLESLADQTVHLGGEEIHFDRGEQIHTEYSYKYTLGGFRALAAEAGLEVEEVWTDDRRLFSVQYLRAR
jgi:dimethylhistidine N-methyltransferase